MGLSIHYRLSLSPEKDADGDGNGVQARIFEHPQFARLEAEGETLLRGGKAGA